MTRDYAAWQHDARNTTKSVTQLGNELRDHWDTWKTDAPYETFDECILTELGITAQALRDRNKRARRRATIADATVAEPEAPQPPRQVVKPASPAEIERRRTHAAALWNDGHTADSIAPILGVSRRTIQMDLAVKGAEGRRPPVSKPRETPAIELHWRNEDLGITDDESPIEIPSFAACTTPSAKEAIEDVRVQLALILGGRYRLSLKDRNNLITVLTTALERARNGNPEETQSSRQSTRVAG